MPDFFKLWRISNSQILPKRSAIKFEREVGKNILEGGHLLVLNNSDNDNNNKRVTKKIFKFSQLDEIQLN